MKYKICYFLTVISEQILKYTFMLDILIHQFVHIAFSDDTLSIPLNFGKTIWSQ